MTVAPAHRSDPRRHATAAAATATVLAGALLALGLAVGTESGDRGVALLGRTALATALLAAVVAGCGFAVRAGRAPTRTAATLTGVVALGTLGAVLLTFAVGLPGGTVVVSVFLALMVGFLGGLLAACAYGIAVASRTVRARTSVDPGPVPPPRA